MLVYILKSTFCLVLLLGVYHLFLEKEKMHRFNRFYLLGCILFSFIVPSFTITVAPEKLETPLFTEVSTLEQFPVETASLEVTETINYTQYIIGLYILVSLILFVLLSRKVYNLLHKAKQNKQLNYFSATVVLLKERIVPYTFLQYIFINKFTYQTDSLEEQILTHELAHVEQKHSIDVLLIEVLQNLFWFNPIFRYYKKAIQLNHEFLADDAVINSHKNITEYQQVLLNTTAQNNNIYLASNLNYSLTKKRFLMMTTPSSKTKILLKKLLVAPLVAGFIFAFAQRVEAQEKLPQVVEVKEQLQNNNELLIFINKDGKLNIKNQNVAYSNLNKVLNKEIDDINEAKIILKTDPNAPLRFANLTKIKNALRQNGIYSINFENFIVSPKDKIIIKNKNWSSKTVRPQVIEVVEQQKTGFHKNWFITIDGQKYYYTFDRKERVARYYKNGKLVKLDIIKEYGKKHKLFERLKSTGKHYVFKSKKEQKVIDREFSDLGGMYYRMPRKNKNKVSRPDHPSKPYVTLWKSGEKFYKKRSELTKEDRLLMMPPPPPPNASKEELKKFKASMRTWRERTGQKIQVREIKPERIEVIKKKKKDSKPQIREVKPVKIEVIKKKNGLVEVIETPDWKGAKKKLKEVEELTEVKELVEVRELKEVEEKEVVEQHELREVEESIEVKEAPLVIEILEDVKEQEFVTIDKIDSLTNDEIIALNKVQKSNSKKIYYINNKEISKKKFKKLKLGKIKKLRVKKGKDKVSHIYITL
jgi:biopolymer transport protein ExbD